MDAIFVLEPNGQSLLSLLGTLAPPGGHFPGTPHYLDLPSEPCLFFSHHPLQ